MHFLTSQFTTRAVGSRPEFKASEVEKVRRQNHPLRQNPRISLRYLNAVGGWRRPARQRGKVLRRDGVRVRCVVAACFGRALSGPPPLSLLSAMLARLALVVLCFCGLAVRDEEWVSRWKASGPGERRLSGGPSRNCGMRLVRPGPQRRQRPRASDHSTGACRGKEWPLRHALFPFLGRFVILTQGFGGFWMCRNACSRAVQTGVCTQRTVLGR